VFDVRAAACRGMAANADRPEPVRRAATGPMAGPGRHIFAAHLFAILWLD